MNTAPTPRLQRLLTSLCTLLAAHLPRQPDPLPGFLVWQWLQRLIHRLETLATRLAAGPAMPALPPGLPRATLPALPAWPAPRAPQSRGWLLALSPDFAEPADQLRQLLQDRNFQTLLRHAPQLAPALRRLLRLLDIACPTQLAAKRPPPRAHIPPAPPTRLPPPPPMPRENPA